MKIKKQETNLIGLVLALEAFLLRFIYIYLLQYKNLADFIKWMPLQNHRRALSLVTDGLAHYGNAWGGYYLFLGLNYKFFDLFGVRDFVRGAMLVQIIISSLTVFWFFKIAEKMFGKFKAIISTALVIFYFPLIYFTAILSGETVMMFLLVLGIWWFLNQKWLRSGLIIGLAAAIKPVLMSFIPFWLVYVFFKFKAKKKFKLSRLFLGIFVPLLVFGSLNMVFSHQHKFQLNGSTGVNLAMAQCRFKKVEYTTLTGENHWFSPPAFWDSQLPQKETEVAFYDNGYYVKMALNCLREHPMNLINNLVYVKNIFSSKFYPKFQMEPLMDQMLVVSKVMVLIGLALFLIYPLLTKKRGDYWLFWLLFFCMILSVYLANPGEERYIIPYAWILFLFLPEAVEKILFYIKRLKK